METSFMYHCLGLRAHECTCTRYEGGRIIFEIRTRDDKLSCARCGSRHVIKSGSAVRRFLSVPIGSRQIMLEMTVQRLECKDCGAIRQKRPSVRMLRHTTEHNDAQTKATPKERLRTVEEFVEQLEQAVQKRL